MSTVDFDTLLDCRGSMSKKWDTHDPDIIPMWIADSDFASPREIVEALQKRAAFPMYGYLETGNGAFERAVCLWEKKRFGWDVTPDEVIYTPAVLPGIVNAFLAFTHPGDHIVVQTPIYHPFNHIIPQNGRHLEANPLIPSPQGTWEIDWEDLDARLAHPRTTLFLLCSPHNPLARYYTLEELQGIAELCQKHDVFIVADEIHSDLVYHGLKHHPFATVSSWAADHCLVCINPSKTFNLGGLRAGAAIIPNPYCRKLFRNSLEALHMGGRDIFSIFAAIAAYTSCDYYADELVKYLEGNVVLLQRFLRERMPRIKVHNVQATYLLWLDCRDLQLDHGDLIRFFLEEARVALSDGRTFGREGTGCMRMNIACPRSRLQSALERIHHAYMQRGF